MATVYKIHPAIGVARVGTSDSFYIAPETPGGLPTDPVTGAPVTSFRDANGNLLKQAARFRVFAYDSNNPDDPGTEVTVGENGVAAIEWTVYLANKKAVWYQFEQLTGSGQEGDPGYIANGPTLNPMRNASITHPEERQQLILDPGPRTIGGTGNPATAEFNLSGPVTDPALMLPFPVTTLGSIQLDANGNLLVLAGNGASGTMNVNPAGSPYQYILLTYANNDGWFDDLSDGPV
ncbi:MAG: LodA/GoxA family CTQ-dependent oxidase, partial [Thermoanaerobaculia bacterium]